MAIAEIDRSLKCLFAEAEGGVAWLRRPRRRFENRSALEAMLDAGEGLSRVQATLSALAASSGDGDTIT
ncbi:antitoxin Xre/MbcA/ParS toxin-binding domain-containing protein [Tranquillimonas alkanivorans]|uniref:antitoxin Xre/MbcA/ParS toxin-binding domain-containing protein n=1 Tax=Tranquillimonas alkanivorans TaxID=441119 RepID=UPI000B88D2F2|nr:antitoxin Xre/MbcA/ParS toxin-binding domain-containing protein [Tranquillimonas alkanivorans]